MPSGDWDVLTVKATALFGGHEFQVEVEERVFPDRTCGQMEGGARAYAENGNEYFISDAGVVWLQPHNIEIGIAPAVKAEADKLEAELDRMYEAEEISEKD
jgi:hypothetical protein